MCHYSSLWVQKGLLFKITQVWNIIRITSRLFDDLAKYRCDLFHTVPISSVWGRLSPQHSMCLCLCVCSFLRLLLTVLSIEITLLCSSSPNTLQTPSDRPPFSIKAVPTANVKKNCTVNTKILKSCPSEPRKATYLKQHLRNSQSLAVSCCNDGIRR